MATTTPTEILTILDRLEAFDPQRRLSGKRAQLAAVRDRLITLHAKGHSWRSIARELSATGEKVSADLLRSICKTKPRRRAPIATRSANPPERPAKALADARSAPAAAIKSDGRFGAKGLKP